MSEEMQMIVDALTFDSRLWTIDDVAKYLNRSKSTVTNYTSKLPDFPGAIRLAGNHDKPLYDPKDVKRWALSKKEKN